MFWCRRNKRKKASQGPTPASFSSLVKQENSYEMSTRCPISLWNLKLTYSFISAHYEQKKVRCTDPYRYERGTNACLTQGPPPKKKKKWLSLSKTQFCSGSWVHFSLLESAETRGEIKPLSFWGLDLVTEAIMRHKLNQLVWTHESRLLVGCLNPLKWRGIYLMVMLSRVYSSYCLAEIILSSPNASGNPYCVTDRCHLQTI